MTGYEDYADTLSLQIMGRLADAGKPTDCIHDILDLVRAATGMEAAGIRLRDGDDYPYYVSKGFSESFLLAETSLCARDPGTGMTILGADGEPVLECMCGNIIYGRTDPAQPFFTKGGSFWSNGTTRLLATTTDADRQGRTRATAATATATNPWPTSPCGAAGSGSASSSSTTGGPSASPSG